VADGSAGSGSLTFRFFKYGEWRHVTVDGRLPVAATAGGGPQLASAARADGWPRDLWPGLIEKAYARLHGGYPAIAGGGSVARALVELTGGVPVKIKVEQQDDADGVGAADPEALFLQLKGLLDGGAIVCVQQKRNPAVVAAAEQRQQQEPGDAAPGLEEPPAGAAAQRLMVAESGLWVNRPYCLVDAKVVRLGAVGAGSGAAAPAAGTTTLGRASAAWGNGMADGALLVQGGQQSVVHLLRLSCPWEGGSGWAGPWAAGSDEWQDARAAAAGLQGSGARDTNSFWMEMR